jgi:hypothetical protein
MQSISSGAFKACQWTGMGFKKYIGDPVNLERSGLPGMPDDLFSRSLKKAFKQIVRGWNRAHWNLFDSSHVYKFSVSQVPLKPTVSWVDDPDLHRILSESRDGLAYFFPMKIDPRNIGANRDLLYILKDLDTQKRKLEEESDSKTFKVVCVDCNIFMRILKV